MPTNQQLVAQAISDYQTLLRRNGGEPTGLAFTATTDVAEIRERIRKGEVVTQADVDLYRRKLLVEEIAKQREKSQFPEKFWPRDETSLAEHLDKKLTLDQKEIIQRGEIRAQATAKGEVDPLHPSRVDPRAPLLTALDNKTLETLQNTVQAAARRASNQKELEAMLKRDIARDLARSQSEADEIASKVLRDIGREIAEKRGLTGAPKLEAGSAEELAEFKAMLAKTKFNPGGGSFVATTNSEANTAFLKKMSDEVIPPVKTTVPGIAIETPKIPGAVTRSTKGILPALVVGAGVGLYTLANGSTPAEAAVVTTTTAAEGILPGSTTGFNGIIGKNVRPVDRALNILNTGTQAGVLVTGATGQFYATGVLAVANVVVNGAKDVAYVTGAGDEAGFVGEAIVEQNKRNALFDKVDKALVAGRSTPDTERLNDLRSNRGLIQRQAALFVQQYDPNQPHKFGTRIPDPPPMKTADGRTLTSYRDIREELQKQYSEAHAKYFEAVIETGKTRPEAIAGLTGEPVTPKEPAKVAQTITTEDIKRQMAANLKATTDPVVTDEKLPPAQVVAAGDDKKKVAAVEPAKVEQKVDPKKAPQTTAATV